MIRLLLRGSYDLNGKDITQYFATSNDELYNAVVFKVLSNHGHEDYTCVYKVGVHGILAN